MAQRLYYRKFNKLDFQKDDALTMEKSVFHAFRSKMCPHCFAVFSTYSKQTSKTQYWDNPERTGEPKIKVKVIWFFICYKCGWWQITEKEHLEDLGLSHDPFIYHSILERVEENSERAKIITLRQSLQKDWEGRKNLSAGDAAEIVRDIMKEHYNCNVIHTQGNVNTPDGGIDLLVGHDGQKVLAAVQVKRRKNGDPEGISHVREFVGALAIQGQKNGVFVTTAERFTRTVHKEQKLLHENSHIKLDLIASSQLLELLNATTPYDSPILPLDLSANSYWQSGDRYYSSLEVLMGLPGNNL